METPPSSPNSPSQGATRESLRDLRERAQSSLQRQRQRMQELESRFPETLQDVAEQLVGELLDESQGANHEVTRQAQEDLDRQRREWEAELASTDADISARMDDLATQLAEVAQRESDLATREGELNSQREQLEASQAELAEDRAALDAEVTAAGQEADERVQLLEQELADERQQLTVANEQHRQLQEQRERLATDLQAEREKLESQRAAWQETSDRSQAELNERIGELESQLAESAKTHQQQLAEANEKLQAQQAAVEAEEGRAADNERESAAWAEERAQLIAERNQIASTLEAVSQELAATRESQETLDELQGKFDLALADVRQLRQQNAELEQELAHRPQQSQDNSAEFTALREECEALQNQVRELESRPPATGDEAGSQEMADLQRRFEMAVEDVRQLRADNEQLEEKLAQRPQAAPASGGGEEKWEDLKRKLLMSLEDETGEMSDSRQEERASIEHTIRITDDVVASKDREILDLKQQLEANEVATTQESVDRESLENAADCDEYIQQQRQKLAEMEHTLTEKLRKTEMELSLERAKIAREQSELADWRIELESLRDSLPLKGGEGGTNTGGGGKGRWFSKLGLGGDE